MEESADEGLTHISRPDDADFLFFQHGLYSPLFQDGSYGADYEIQTPEVERANTAVSLELDLHYSKVSFLLVKKKHILR